MRLDGLRQVMPMLVDLCYPIPLIEEVAGGP
jgi:hypothetical protein